MKLLLSRYGAVCFLTALCVSNVVGGHTRIGYVDGGQSQDGRFTVTAELQKNGGKTPWKFVWTDTKTKETHTGSLLSLQDGEHFTVVYAHIYVAPDGQTFAVWNTNAFSAGDKKLISSGQDLLSEDRKKEDFQKFAGFSDRLVIYKKNGEVVKRLSMFELLKPAEWKYVFMLQGNLYWLAEYEDAFINKQEPPRMGYRHTRVSPDYTVLEFMVGPTEEVRLKYKLREDATPEQKAEAAKYKRVVRVRLTDGVVLEAAKKLNEPNRVPVRCFVPLEGFTRAGQEQFVPSLDPVRVAGKLDPTKNKLK